MGAPVGFRPASWHRLRNQAAAFRGTARPRMIIGGHRGHLSRPDGGSGVPGGLPSMQRRLRIARLLIEARKNVSFLLAQVNKKNTLSLLFAEIGGERRA